MIQPVIKKATQNAHKKSTEMQANTFYQKMFYPELQRTVLEDYSDPLIQ